ncbi:MAG TPA: hypothetical protein IAD32_03015 [Candidatus Scatavimonas merdigallinarum]|uniref:YbbR-like protein n=1 Tax=Candidatus Scatavimonas merdigallinarum TaxID=2840914 RepID=A0A9D1CUK9_9FIRM|nr:hypothetical protein [Candidatus Scatavimonas merdigallinarum]
MKRIKSFSLSKLFRNNKFLIVFSFLMACGLWLFFSQNTQEAIEYTVSDIPITIPLSDAAKEDGLTIFSGGDTTASVLISGNRLTVANVTKDDIQVVALQASNTITAPNTYSLELTARKNGVKSDYEILSVTPQIVSVYVDRQSSREFSLTDNVDYSGIRTDSTYFRGKAVYSTDTITVSGPQTEVMKVDKVAIEGGFSGDLRETTSQDYEIVLYDTTGTQIKSELLTTNVENNMVTVTVPVLPKKELPLEPQFTDVPSGFDVGAVATVTPSSLMIAGSEEAMQSLNSISLQAIDFSQVSPDNTEFTLPIDLPAGCINISNESNATVSLDLSGYDSTVLTVSRFTFDNLDDGYTAVAMTTSIDVTVIGPEDVVSELTASDVEAQIDLSSLGDGFVGTAEMPVNIRIKNQSKCWAYDTQAYTANVTVSRTE